jgi:hypothetical protein
MMNKYQVFLVSCGHAGLRCAVFLASVTIADTAYSCGSAKSNGRPFAPSMKGQEHIPFQRSHDLLKYSLVFTGFRSPITVL